MEPLQIVPLSALRRKVDFGIITMREDEFEAVLKRFPPTWVIIDGECQYNVAVLQQNRSGKLLHVAIVRTTEPGHSEAQAAATHLQNELDPSCLVLVGIGGAKPESEFTLGDVVAGARLHDFSITAAIANSNVEYAVSGGPAHRRVQNALANLAATRSFLGDWNSEAAIGKPLPPVDLTDDNVVGDDSWKEKVRKSLKFRFCSPEGHRPPLATAVTLGSGKVLMKDPALLQQWLEFARDLKVVEMERPGVFAAARSIIGDRPVLAIRGISDVVGFIRDPRWTEYACHN
jgi:nucleoside phosphorylase